MSRSHRNDRELGSDGALRHSAKLLHIRIAFVRFCVDAVRTQEFVGSRLRKSRKLGVAISGDLRVFLMLLDQFLWLQTRAGFRSQGKVHVDCRLDKGGYGRILRLLLA